MFWNPLREWPYTQGQDIIILAFLSNCRSSNYQVFPSSLLKTTLFSDLKENNLDT